MRILIPLFSLFVLVSACGQPAPDAQTSTSAASAADMPPAMASAELGALHVANAWAAATPGGAVTAAAYLDIANPGAQPDRLIGVSSPRAGRVELHETVRATLVQGDLHDTIMSMRRIEAVDIPAGETAQFSAGGRHIMFFQIDAPFVAGQTVPIQLRFERNGVLEMQLPILARHAAADPDAGESDHAH